jgi:hypothetical protein
MLCIYKLYDTNDPKLISIIQEKMTSIFYVGINKNDPNVISLIDIATAEVFFTITNDGNSGCTVYTDGVDIEMSNGMYYEFDLYFDLDAFKRYKEGLDDDDDDY